MTDEQFDEMMGQLEILNDHLNDIYRLLEYISTRPNINGSPWSE